METEARLVHSLNAQFPILVTLLGMTMEVSPVQFPKAVLSILVTLLGMLTEVSPLQPSKTRIWGSERNVHRVKV